MPNVLAPKRRKTVLDVDTATENILGMQAGIERPQLFPFMPGPNGVEFTAPQFIYDLARSAVTPGVAWKGGQISPEDALNLASMMMGSGLGYTAIRPVQGKAIMGANAHALDMSKEARLARAAEQGFDTNTVWHHGAQRLDRLLEKDAIDPKRATSGPMPYLTDSPELASSYAKGKADTSLGFDEGYHKWFSVKAGPGKPKDLDSVWWHLKPEERDRITKTIGRVTEDDDRSGKFFLGEGPGGKSHWEWTLKQHHGNAIRAAKEIWLESGLVYGEEEKFAKVLKMGGLDRVVEFTSPLLEHPGIMSVYAKVKNPLETSNKESLVAVLDAVRKASKGKRYKPYRNGVDQWDKSNIGIREWGDRLAEDIENNTTHAWTSIPDDVTKVLKDMGYDGVLDVSGKGGGKVHKVLIPFRPNQVRSVNAAFDPRNMGSAKLLGGIGAAALGAASMLDKEKKSARK